METKGMERNGMEWNGMKWKGIKTNRHEWKVIEGIYGIQKGKFLEK